MLCWLVFNAAHISIHAPRTGSDLCSFLLVCFIQISIHAPRTGSDVEEEAITNVILRHFNPRSPHGERRDSLPCSTQRSLISIHAPRTGSDYRVRADAQTARQFQSTLPARGATRWNPFARFR